MLALASSKASASAVASCYFVLPASRVLLEPPLSLRSATLASEDISSLQMYSMMYIALPQSTCIQICNNRLLSRTYLICTSMCTVYALPMYCVSVNQYISSRTSLNVATCYLYRCHIITEYPTLQYWDNLKKEMRHTSLPYIVDWDLKDLLWGEPDIKPRTRRWTLLLKRLFSDIEERQK